jgi:hypothetical protein
MRIVASLAAVAAALCFSAPVSAQVVSVSQVLSDCPDIDQAQPCTTLASAFLDGRSPGRRLDGQIIDLVVAISEAASQEKVPRPVCLNAADGLRILATGVTREDQAQQIEDIADALCTGARTASLGRRPGFLLFDSLGGGGVGGGGNGGTGGGGGGGVVPDPDPTGCVTDCPPNGGGGGGTGGGLGSNGAGKGNETAMAHANEHALNNDHGNNEPKDD